MRRILRENWKRPRSTSSNTLQLRWQILCKHTFVHVAPSFPGTAKTPPSWIKSIQELRQETAQLAPPHRNPNAIVVPASDIDGHFSFFRGEFLGAWLACEVSIYLSRIMSYLGNARSPLHFWDESGSVGFPDLCNMKNTPTMSRPLCPCKLEEEHIFKFGLVGYFCDRFTHRDLTSLFFG